MTSSFTAYHRPYQDSHLTIDSHDHPDPAARKRSYQSAPDGTTTLYGKHKIQSGLVSLRSLHFELLRSDRSHHG